MSGPPTSSTTRSGPGPLELTWWSAAAVPVVVGILGTIASTVDSDLPPALPVALLVAVGVAVTVAVSVLDRTLATSPPSTSQEALARFRQTVFLGIAFGTLPALLGFVMAFVLGPPWTALVGAAVTVVALLRARPSPAHADRVDAAWERAGGTVSLRAAIAELPGGRP